MWKPEVDVSMFSLVTFPPYILRQGFSLNLELAVLAILADYQIPEAPPVSTPQCWDYMQTHHTWLLRRRWWSEIRALRSCCKQPTDPVPLPSFADYGTTLVSENSTGSRVRQGIKLLQCCYYGNFLDDSKCEKWQQHTILLPSKHFQIHHFTWFRCNWYTW